MSVKKTRRNKEIDTLTIAEFKQWLSGVEDMQPDNWTPDATQWAKIRSKIDCLVEPEDQPIVNIPQVQHQPAPYYQPTPYQPAYTTLTELNPQHQPHRPQQSMLLDDGIVMPQKTLADAAFDQGMPHVPNQFD